MKNRQPRAKMNIPMLCACVLLCLTLFSFHLTGGLYARYTTRAEAADNARVVKFGDLTLTEGGDFSTGDPVKVIPGVDLSKKVTVSFTPAEVSTYIFVEVTTDTGWTTANNYEFTAADGKLSWSADQEVWTYHATSENTRVYYHALAANDTFSKDFIKENGKIEVSPELTAVDLNNLKDKIDISFRATVVQNGGFDSVTEAWNSVKTK